ncbi:MAG: AMP-binding protein [Dorea sp.]|nr:AMP-binding protein [Dorea sp.]
MIKCFEETVRSFPDKCAIAYKEQSYTFSELEKRAKEIAGKILIKSGKKKDSPVAVIVNRGADAAALFLGVLYSGNYYIPIDPDMPVEKIGKILKDSGTSLLLYEEEQEGLTRKLVDEEVYHGALLSFEEQVQGADQIDLPDMNLVEADTPAYMVYTSGSTGMPKGVLKSHGAVKSFITTYASTFSLGSDEIIGNQTPFFFDASAKDFYLMVYTGATMEVLPPELFIFPVNLINYLNERKITFACWVPTAFSIVTQLSTFQVVLPETLKKAFFVGEVFPIKQLRKWIETLPDIQYVNLYGSTEISGISCYYEIDTKEEVNALPMGRPLANCEVFLMAGEKLISPEDTETIGEVCVASPALALEYYNDPEKTSKVFVEMMTPSGQVKRVLRSGDLARYDESGNLLFVSRKDFQIKHMGRRIELGEIESIADTLQEIQRCCCIYDTEKKKIKMFCELIPGCEWDGKAVKGALRPKLSEYMMPNKVTIMEKLPLNANGKIDRTALKNKR